jgi:hypothetical protein
MSEPQWTWPIDPICPYCSEGFTQDDIRHDDGRLFFFNGMMRLAHRSCGLRMALGGIGHLTHHAYWCKEKHDPDMGLSYRESSLRVNRWIQSHSIEEAAALGSD